MRKIQMISVVAIMALAMFTGCSKKSNSSGVAAYNMTANVTLGTGGTASTYNGGVCIASVVGGLLSISASTVTAGAGGPPQIAINIQNWNGGTGTTALTTVSTTNSYADYIGAGVYTVGSTTGTVTLSSVSSTSISGTFSFTCTDGTTVNGGAFTAQRL